MVSLHQADADQKHQSVISDKKLTDPLNPNGQDHQVVHGQGDNSTAQDFE